MSAIDQYLTLCKAKVLGARVTETKQRYWASLEVDADILRAAGTLNYEKVLVVNLENGERFETYLIAAPAGSGSVVLAGGTAMLGKAGDEIGFLAFAAVRPDQAENWKPRIVVLNPDNTIKSMSDGDPERLG